VDQQNGDTGDSGRLLRDIVDFVLPLLPPYELSLYLLLLRRSHLAGGEPTVCIGKRSIIQALGKMTRSSGNYQHITEKLGNLAELGFIEVGDTDRHGTRYRVSLPAEVASVRESMAVATDPFLPGDYYNDPSLRQDLFERDGWSCRYCGERVEAGTATLDHMTPVSKGGPNTPENLATCCMMCNSIKAGRTYEEAAPQILARFAGRRGSSPSLP